MSKLASMRSFTSRWVAHFLYLLLTQSLSKISSRSPLIIRQAAAVACWPQTPWTCCRPCRLQSSWTSSSRSNCSQLTAWWIHHRPRSLHSRTHHRPRSFHGRFRPHLPRLHRPLSYLLRLCHPLCRFRRTALLRGRRPHPSFTEFTDFETRGSRQERSCRPFGRG